VQIIRLGRRPALETGRITAHGGEIAIVQPVLHGLFLLQAGPLLLAAVTIVAAQRKPLALFRGAFVIVLHPTAADQQDIADLDVPALRDGPDVQTLPLPARHEVVVRYRVRCRRVVFDPVGVRVGAIVQEYRAAGEAVRRPVVDAAFMVSFLSR